MYLSLNQAAKETGKSKATISKYIRDGKLSVIEKSDSGYKIDPAELFRVFGKNPETSGTRYRSRTPELSPIIPPANTAEMKEIELLRERLAEKNEIIEDLRQERNDWKDQAQKLLLKSPEKPAETRKGFFATLLSKK